MTNHPHAMKLIRDKVSCLGNMLQRKECMEYIILYKIYYRNVIIHLKKQREFTIYHIRTTRFLKVLELCFRGSHNIVYVIKPAITVVTFGIAKKKIPQTTLPDCCKDVARGTGWIVDSGRATPIKRNWIQSSVESTVQVHIINTEFPLSILINLQLGQSTGHTIFKQFHGSLYPIVYPSCILTSS